jgi:hypothetical protein
VGIPRGRIVAAVTFNHGKWLEHYGALIERSGGQHETSPSRFPDLRVPTWFPEVVLTGHDPTSWGAENRPKKR